MDGATRVSDLVDSARAGDQETISQLLPIVYKELKALAGSYLRQNAGHTLQPTALVHEAYLKLVGSDTAWSGRDHFMATAATAMRHVLVDHARKKRAAKRGGDGKKADIEIELLADTARDMRVLELDELLTQLASADERCARVAELRLFGGMTGEQIATVLGVSRRTVTTDWECARAWLASASRGDRHG